jgi:hypothetical protein
MPPKAPNAEEVVVAGENVSEKVAVEVLRMV